MTSNSRFIASSDGLRLHYRDYASSDPASTLAPVVCLHGLARSAQDFDALAQRLAARGRRVLALDYRGRGLSDWDVDWSHYTLDVEQADILAVLADAGVSRAVFVGTSRGGMHVMRLAAAQPGLVLGAALNDIGPEISLPGLLRIRRYVGRLPPLASLEDAVALMRMTAGATFSAVSPDEWEIYARQTFVEKDGKVALRYDPELAHTLDTVKPDATLENYWPQFAAMSAMRVLVVRGANSDILLPETVAEMARRHPGLEICIVEGQGHAPLLLDAPTLKRVEEFVMRCP